MRVLVTGWSSFLHGEATAGDVLSMRRVHTALSRAGIDNELAWSPGFLPGGLHLDAAPPERYSHVVFACGPAHGEQVRALHARYARCYRIAVGVSVVDPADAAVTGFHRVLPRDNGVVAVPDLAASGPTTPVPVVGVAFAPGQREYGARRRHERVHDALEDWLGGLDCARIAVDTRLATTDWRHCATPDQFASVVARLDALITTRLHGLVFALRAGVPALAVDPVAGGGKVTAQAAALGWPAVIPAEAALEHGFTRWWRWCLSPEGRRRAQRCAADRAHCPQPLLTELVSAVRNGVRT